MSLGGGHLIGKSGSTATQIKESVYFSRSLPRCKRQNSLKLDRVQILGSMSTCALGKVLGVRVFQVGYYYKTKSDASCNGGG